MNGSSVEHIAVLSRALAEQIDLPPDGVMVDATIGHGGHSLLFGQRLRADGVIIGLDVDSKALERARERLAGLECRVILGQSNFAEIGARVGEAGFEKVDFILADLGLCSAQLADADAGLSFQSDMPLDMRIDQRIKRSAADIVNEADEECLADLIYEFGQDRASRRIARFIVRHRQRERIETTGQLAAVICEALARPGRKRRSRIHPATRTFQALRIAVNNELENLRGLLLSAPELLKSEGRVAIISYHSLEDGIVKQDFRQNAKERKYAIITRKPLVPDEEEISGNRRSRSAKLRIAERR